MSLDLIRDVGGFGGVDMYLLDEQQLLTFGFYERVQWRKPRSKKRRIQRKWAKRQYNWRAQAKKGFSGIAALKFAGRPPIIYCDMNGYDAALSLWYRSRF